MASGEVSVNWQTLVEVRTLGFRVERSLSGADWARVGAGLIAARGADPQPHGYQVIDTKAPPLGEVVYRLIAVDLEGAERVVAEVYVSRGLSLRARYEPEGLKIELQGVPNGTLVVETTSELGEAWSPGTRYVWTARAEGRLRSDWATPRPRGSSAPLRPNQGG